MNPVFSRMRLSVSLVSLIVGSVTLSASCAADETPLFRTYCAECHGLGGKADGPAAKTLGLPVKPLRGVDRAALEKAVLVSHPAHRGHGIYQQLTRAQLLALIAEAQTLTQH